MSAEEDIRQTRRTLAAKTWVPYPPMPTRGEVCLATAIPRFSDIRDRLRRQAVTSSLTEWNDRQTDVGAVLGMTLEALIAELCKATP